jgi:subtilase family serine protease
MLRRRTSLAFWLPAIALLHGPALALPDAAVARIAVNGANLHDGDRVPVEVELTNRGDSPLPVAPVVLTVDDEPYAEWRPPAPIGPGKSGIWSFIWVANRGSHLIVATADPLNDIAESDESNNSSFVNVGVDQAPEPSPWPVALAGIGAFLVGLGAAVLVNRARPVPRGGVRHAVRRAHPQPPPPPRRS